MRPSGMIGVWGQHHTSESEVQTLGLGLMCRDGGFCLRENAPIPASDPIYSFLRLQIQASYFPDRSGALSSVPSDFAQTDFGQDATVIPETFLLLP